jgi:hypothetical protein
MRDKTFKLRKYLNGSQDILSNPDIQNPILQLIPDATTPYSYTEFLDKLEQYMKLFPGLRTGQAIYNLVDAIDSNFNDDVTGLLSDPFWKDENIPQYVILAFSRGVFTF